MNLLLNDLNAEQVECVLHDAEVLQILAGPGSGKTRVLTVRIALAISQRLIRPEEIIVVTFTNKAARELKQRLSSILGEQVVKKLIVGTFHSVSLRYLQRYGTNIGLDKKISVADPYESKNVVSKVLKALRKARTSGGRCNDSEETQLTPGAALSHISKLKSKGLSPDSARAVVGTRAFPLSLGDTARSELFEVYLQYQQHLKEHNLLDFDDLILRALELLKVCPSVVRSIKHVFVDEFQDTSSQQYELMQLLAQQNRNLTIVGDHDQSIYGFRAADIKNFSRMHATYTNCVEFHLKQNYRSSGAIVLAASALIEQDSARPLKQLETQNIVGTQPTLRVLRNAKTEADWLAKEVTRLLTKTCGLLNASDIAILVRSASLTLPIEQALQRNKINYKMSNARKFLERPHIRPLVNYLRVVQSETSLALLEVVNIPPRKFGQTSLENLQLESSRIRKSLWQTLKAVSQGSILLCKRKDAQLERALGKLVRTIESCRRQIIAEPQMSMVSLLSTIIEEVGYEKFLKMQYPEDQAERMEDVQQFLQTSDILAEAQEGEELPAIHGIDNNDVPQSSLDRLCSALALMSDSEKSKEDAEDCLLISTIHSAKGLEWPVVFIPGVYHGSIPSARAAHEEQDEERRLLYVAMTRAKALLYMSYPERNIRQESVLISSFLAHKNIVPLLDSCGPRITLHVVRDLASVLQIAMPDTRDFVISEDTYQDRTAEQLADEDYELFLKDGKFLRCNPKAVPETTAASKGFTSASTVLAAMPVNAVSTGVSGKKHKNALKSSTQANIKAFFVSQTPLQRQGIAPAISSSSSRRCPIAKEKFLETEDVDDDYRVVLLSSSPERDAPTQLWGADSAPIQPTKEYICTKRELHTGIVSTLAGQPVQKKRLGMSRPRLPKVI